MFNRQLSLLVMATLLLSANVVTANEIDGDGNLSIGNIQIRTNSGGSTIQTPNIKINNPKTTENRTLMSRTRRRTRTTYIKRTPRSSAPVILHQRVSTDGNSTVTTSTSSSTSNPTMPVNSSIRRSTVRSSSNGSESVNEQQQSIQCSGGSSSVSQSTTTVNGRTVRSESRTNCD